MVNLRKTNKKLIAMATLIWVVISLIFLGTILPVSYAAASAQNTNTIQWSGYTWTVRDSQKQLSTPGPNYWSSSNVWVDGNGWLHLKISKVGNHWNCAELASTKSLGYGTFTFYTVSRVDNLDKNVVLGLFAYKDDSHEVDIEYSQWGVAGNTNSWFTVQPPPVYDGVTYHGFNLQMCGDYATSFFTWAPKSVFFETVGGHYAPGSVPNGNIVSNFTSYKSTDATGVKADINLWLFNGVAPSNGLSTEVVLSGFKFTPL